MKRIIKLIIFLIAIPTVTYGATYTLVSASYPVNVNGVKQAVQPLNMNGTTYLPLRAIAEATGLPIEWNNTTKSVEINTLDIEELKRACVMIYADDGKMQDQGSGVYIDYNIVLSANHITDGNTNIKISDGTILTLKDTDKTIDASILNSPVGVKPVKIGDSDDVKVGDKVVLISAPKGKDDTVSYGVVKEINSEIIVSGVSDGGSSGGAVFSQDGSLIGMLVAGDTEFKIWYVTPINIIRKEL